MAEFDLGVLGGGQLGRMSIQAAQRMGLSCVSLDPGSVTPASAVAPARVGSLSDPDAIADLARHVEFLTYESEFIPVEAVREGIRLAQRPESVVVPSLETLEVIQDKLRQRETYLENRVPSPIAVAIEGNGEAAGKAIGFPMVIKARFGGYDGKGTRFVADQGELEAYRPLWEGGGWLAEGWVEFDREVAVMVYLSPHGDGAFPTMETVQSRHVCDHVFPAQADASQVALAAARSVGGTGLYGVELFELKNGDFWVNEIAPRPHNSGHYTLDWGGVSQFEQHVRIAIGLPPATPSGQPVCMANLLGQEGADDWRMGLRAALEDPAVRAHWYGKAESRPGRKMGHLNALGPDAVGRALAARERFYRAWVSGTG